MLILAENTMELFHTSTTLLNGCPESRKEISVSIAKSIIFTQTDGDVLGVASGGAPCNFTEKLREFGARRTEHDQSIRVVSLVWSSR